MDAANMNAGTAAPTSQNEPGVRREMKSRFRSMGLILLVSSPFLCGLAVVLIILIPEKASITIASSNNDNGIEKERSTSLSALVTVTIDSNYLHGALNISLTMDPTSTPTTSEVPTATPTQSPTAAPTIPEMGCLGTRRDNGDRFDNEGNSEGNNKLFAGQYVCSTPDPDQDYIRRYHFGIEPETGNLIMKDIKENTRRTYYTNEFHREYLQQQQQQENRRKLIESDWNETFIGDTASSSFYLGNTTMDSEETDFSQEPQTAKDGTNEYPIDERLTTAAAAVLDYYFSMSTEAAFRIHRVQRTEDYQIVQEEVLWELPSTYNITLVYKNCLKTHDCPYLHLHRDGVMVLAWLDFALSEWFDGWMEKNIRRCYNFNTTDEL